MAPVIKKLKQEPRIESRVCVTAQHRYMLDQVLDLSQIKPDVDLNIMMDNQGLAEVGAAILSGLKPVLEEYQPDLVLVQGDTSTTFFAALAAFYRQVPVGHVEAGLRTGDMSAPWPEEMNRRVASILAGLHFAATEQSWSCWWITRCLRKSLPRRLQLRPSSIPGACGGEEKGDILAIPPASKSPYKSPSHSPPTRDLDLSRL